MHCGQVVYGKPPFCYLYIAGIRIKYKHLLRYYFYSCSRLFVFTVLYLGVYVLEVYCEEVSCMNSTFESYCIYYCYYIWTLRLNTFVITVYGESCIINTLPLFVYTIDIQYMYTTCADYLVFVHIIYFLFSSYIARFILARPTIIIRYLYVLYHYPVINNLV